MAQAMLKTVSPTDGPQSPIAANLGPINVEYLTPRKPASFKNLFVRLSTPDWKTQTYAPPTQLVLPNSPGRLGQLSPRAQLSPNWRNWRNPVAWESDLRAYEPPTSRRKTDPWRCTSPKPERPPASEAGRSRAVLPSMGTSRRTSITSPSLGPFSQVSAPYTMSSAGRTSSPHSS